MARLAKVVAAVGIAVVLFAGGTRARVAKLNAANDDSFLEDCVWDRCRFRDNHVMGTYCNNDSSNTFDYDWTQIDMGRCLGNNGGRLVVREDGEFYKSCDDCRLTNKHEDGTQYLVCDCWGTDDKKHESRVDLATVMYNEDGRMGCFDHKGSKHKRPPPYWDDDEKEDAGKDDD